MEFRFNFNYYLMGKSQETFNKKEREKKRQKKRQDKLVKKEERKSTSLKGASFEDMFAYVDENGQITDTPPDLTKKKKIDASTIELGATKREAVDEKRVGKVSYFDDAKGYGFVIEKDTQEKYFVHVSGLMDKVKENDKISFELERGTKGLNAVRVKKI
jgi:cold shock CspA family protein